MNLYCIKNKLELKFYILASNVENAIKEYKKHNKEEIIIIYLIHKDLMIGE